MKLLRLAAPLMLLAFLTGCELVVLEPAGDIAAQQGKLIIYATVLMLIVIVPVMALTAFFAFHYRASNGKSSYAPEWSHSVSLEIVVWTLPLAIIICLAGLTWVATHRLEPYNDLSRISATQPIDPTVQPLTIQVVALDWKWLFIYPEQGIATVNEVAAVVNRPIEFKLTSDTVMNSFYIPALAGQIYAMPGMETELNAVINRAGDFEGFSANYSGNGFSKMCFRFHGMDEAGFEDWVQQVRDGSETSLSRENYVALAQPTTGNPVSYYNGVADDLWRRALNLCVTPGVLCMDDMMMVDALGGGGLLGLMNREIFAGICAADDALTLYQLLHPDTLPEGPQPLASPVGQSPLLETR